MEYGEASAAAVTVVHSHRSDQQQQQQESPEVEPGDRPLCLGTGERGGGCCRADVPGK